MRGRRLARGRARLQLALAALLMAGVWVAVPAVAHAASTDAAVAFQLDAAHDGDQSSDPISPPLSHLWTATLPGATSYPLIVNGIVYVATNQSVYALDQATGATLWSYGGATDDGVTGLAYDAGEVFTVVFTPTPGANTLDSLTALDAQTGAVDWTAAITSDVWAWSAPTAADGFVYVTGGDSVYAIADNGQLGWRAVDDGNGGMPAVDSSGVYVVDDGPQDYSFDPFTGAQRWRYDPTGGDGGASTTPVLANGYVFARDPGLGDTILTESGGAASGQFTSTTPPAVGGGMAYEVNDGALSAVTDSGQGATAWTFDGDSGLDTAPLISGDLVFEGSSSGEVYAVDSTGASVWSANTGSAIAATDEADSGPLVGLASGGGTLVVPAGDTVVAYEGTGLGGGTPVDTAPPQVVDAPYAGDPVGADVGTWTGLPVAYGYQWLHCDGTGGDCSPIDGATGAAYTPIGSDIGSTLEVEVTATNADGTSSEVSSVPSPPVAAAPAYAPPTIAAQPEISGPLVQGDTVNASTGNWYQQPTSFSYRWLDCLDGACAQIPGATSSSYLVSPADIGEQLAVDVTATNAAGSTTVQSPPTDYVTTLGPQSVAPPAISGVAEVGQPLTASLGTWTGDPTSYAFVWISCDPTATTCNVVGDPDDMTYTPTTSDIGNYIVLAVYAENSLGVSALTLSPDPAGPVLAASPPPAAPPSSNPPASASNPRVTPVVGPAPVSPTGVPVRLGGSPSSVTTVVAPAVALLHDKINARSRTATFTIQARGDALTLQCALVRMPNRPHARRPSPSYEPCRSPATFTGLKRGATYVFHARAVDPAGTVEAALTRRFTIK